MATIETYRTADGIRYRVRYRTPENKQTSKRGFKTKKEASLFVAKIEVDMAAGEYVNPAAGRATVGELSKVWLMTKRSLKPSAYKPLEIALKVYVLPRWGDVPVGKVKPSAVEAWLTQIAVGEAVTNHAYAAERAKPKSATTVLRALGVLAGGARPCCEGQAAEQEPRSRRRELAEEGVDEGQALPHPLRGRSPGYGGTQR